MRTVIVNADDFGRSTGITNGILEAHRDGIVTSTSLMVRWPAAEEAAAAARENTNLGVGLHIDVGEWALRDGEWRAVYEVVEPSDPVGLRREVEHQLERFRALMGREPTHIDSHQHRHLDPDLAAIARDVGERLGIPVRHMTAGVGYCGDFYGQTAEGDPYPEGISVDQLVRVLTRLDEGTTEIACHPGRGGDPDDQYGPQRKIELAALTDPKVREAVREQELQLTSFHSLGAGG